MSFRKFIKSRKKTIDGTRKEIITQCSQYKKYIIKKSLKKNTCVISLHALFLVITFHCCHDFTAFFLILVRIFGSIHTHYYYNWKSAYYYTRYRSI